MKLRPYQALVLGGIRDVWSRGGTPLLVLPTGAGKTVVFARALRDHVGPAVAIAHRRELVGQMSLALAREGVVHKIIAPKNTIKSIIHNNTVHIGRSCYDPNAPVAVAGVDSIQRAEPVWRDSVTLWVMDEAHHVLRSNKWGRAVALFTNAKGLGVTATPNRADGKGVGIGAEGVFTDIVVGPSMRELIDDGNLCDYRIFTPPSTVDMSGVKRSSKTGDYVRVQMVEAVNRADLTGDIVEHYLRIAPGKLGVTFAVNVISAQLIAAAFNAAGVPALAIDAKTPGPERQEALNRFRRREILQLVNVDLFGEGFDLPAIEVVSFARPTHSFPLYCQSFGRALRPMEGKDRAIIIDHVGNVAQHGLPDYPSAPNLLGRMRGPAVRECQRCGEPHLASMEACPFCDHIHVPEENEGGSGAAVMRVEGDLIELTEDTLNAMRADAARRVMPEAEYEALLRQQGCPEIGVRANLKRHRATMNAQANLRLTMDWWRALNTELSESESYRLFFSTYGLDVLTAHALKATDAAELADRVRSDLPQALQQHCEAD